MDNYELPDELDREIIITESGVVPSGEGSPVGFERRTLTLANGETLPVIAAIERKMSLATKFLLCHGSESACAEQCPLVSMKQEEFRGYPCPLEVEIARDLIYGLARELELKAFEETGQHFVLSDIVEEITQYSLMGEYIKWELISHRNDMELAKNRSVLGERPFETKLGAILKEKVIHPGIQVAQIALKAKVDIQREFMSTKKGRLERLRQESQVNSTLAKLIETVRERLPQEELREIEAERVEKK